MRTSPHSFVASISASKSEGKEKEAIKGNAIAIADDLNLAPMLLLHNCLEFRNT